jgi:hypothetical protein
MKSIREIYVESIMDLNGYEKCPYCGIDGIVRYAGGAHICNNCKGEGFIDALANIQQQVQADPDSSQDSLT